MMFTFFPLIFLVVAKPEHQGAAKMLIHAYISADHTTAKFVIRGNGVFSKTVLAACRRILTGKYKDSVGQNT